MSNDKITKQERYALPYLSNVDYSTTMAGESVNGWTYSIADGTNAEVTKTGVSKTVNGKGAGTTFNPNASYGTTEVVQIPAWCVMYAGNKVPAQGKSYLVSVNFS